MFKRVSTLIAVLSYLAAAPVLCENDTSKEHLAPFYPIAAKNITLVTLKSGYTYQEHFQFIGVDLNADNLTNIK